MWARRTRILLIGGVLTLGLLATLLLQSPVPTQTVDEFMISPEQYVDQEVALRGEVQDGTIDNTSMTFVLEGTASTIQVCLLYTSPSPRDVEESRMPSSA